MLGKLTVAPSTVQSAGFNLPQGTAPTSPNNGDIWTTLSGVFARINGVTQGPFGAIGPSSFGATPPISVSFPANVVTYALATDANFSVVTNALALANGGVAYPSGVTGGAKGAGTINASGLYVSNAAVLTGNQTITLTGDVTGTGTTAITTTLATVNGDVGTFGGASSVPNFTVNAKGLITAAGATAVVAPAATLSGGTLASNVLASSLTSVGTLTGGATGAGFTIDLGASTISGRLGYANFVQGGAATITGNPTGSTADQQSFTIQGLTALGSPDATLDFIPIYDHVAGTIKRVTPSAIAGSVVAGVASINGNTGVFTTSNGIATVVNDIQLAAIAADRLLMNATGSSAAPTAVAVGNCATALTYDTSGHAFGCRTANGTGNMVQTTSASLVTPALGVASATSINKVAITAPATGSTLTIADGKTATFNNSIQFSGTDSTTMTFPSSNATIAALNLTGQNLTGGATVTAVSLGTMSSFTLNCGTGPLQYGTNNGAFTLTAPAADSSCILRVTNGASAGAITFSGWTIGTNTGDAYVTTNGKIFDLFVRRINGAASYSWSAIN